MASYEGKNEEERKGKKSGSLRLRKPKDRPKLVDLQPASAPAGAVEVPQPGRDRADSATTTPASMTTPPGEEGTAADSPNKKRHQRTRSVGKGGLMNLIGLKKNKNNKGKSSTTEQTQADVERNVGTGRYGSSAAQPSVDDAEEREQHSKKTVSAVVTGTTADNCPHPGPGEGGGDCDAEEDESVSSSSTAVDEQPIPTGVDTEEDEADPSSAASAVVGSSVSWHSSSSGGAIRRKLPSSSSSLQEQTEPDDPQPSSPAEDASLARPTAPRPVPDHGATLSSAKRVNRRSLSTQAKLFPPLPSAPGPTAAKETEAVACSPLAVSVLAQAAANGPASARQVPANVSAVSAMHQTRPNGRKRMTMDAGALKALYAQDPGFQRRLSNTAASLSTQRSQSAVVETPEVLLALQTLAEQGIEEEDIWHGKPEVFPLLEPFKNELKKAAEVGCKSSAINFLLPDIPFFGGLKAKTFKVNNLQPIAHLLRAITAKLGGKSMTLRRSSFALTTLAGHQLDPSEVLASYGLGSILQMWELKIVVLKRGVSGVHAAVDKKPLPNPQQLIFEQVKGLQSQAADLGQRVGRAETERRQIEARMEELAREMEKNETEREEARAADEAERQQRLRREWRLDVESGIERLRDESQQREARLHAEAKELRDALEQERGQARAKEDRLASAVAALMGEVEAMRGREAQERVEGLVAAFREEMEERERERTQREQALREEIEHAQALMKGGEEAKQAQSELDVAKVVAALQAENDRQRKELVRRVHDDWERERQALVVHLRAEWERETRAAVQRLREDWERERAKEHEDLTRRAREEREQREEKQREQAERERREVRSLVEQESGKAVREVLEEVAGKVAKLQGHLEASEKKVERQAKALELLDKRVKAAAVTPPSAPSSSAVTPPPPPPPTVVTPSAGLPIIAKPAASKRPALQREDRSCANLLLAGLQKRFSAIQQSQAEELEEAGDDASWQYTP